MQQPRQMYGLGSFVKKLTRKVTRPITKVAKKIVPREIAGIMRTAAPFLPAGYREAAYLLGTAKQTGRISPIDLALTAAPTFFSKTDVGQNMASRAGAMKVPFTGGRNLSDVLIGTPDPVLGQGGTEGILGTGGKMFQFGGDKGIVDQFRDFRDQSKLGSLLLEGDKGTFSKSKIAGLGIGTLSLIQNSKTPEEAGTALAQATGDSDDYERGYQLFSSLPQGIFDIPTEYRLPSANGGLMRTNYARGSDDKGPVLPSDEDPINPFGPQPIGPVLPDKSMMAGSDRYQRILEELINELEGRLGRELTNDEYDMVGKLAYDKLSDPDYAVGGRVDYALGTRPTAQESGLGGLPIEADMRYTGGFMPYGAKEKADDVPARLSKNEFVFTADAVRAAGGGSVNQGAKKMYATMKNLEKKPEAKGMTA